MNFEDTEALYCLCSTLEIFLSMHYINLHFTYFTYLLLDNLMTCHSLRPMLIA